MEPSHPIVFFDGVCGLCNRAVDFLLRIDRARRLRYAPLQGATAARLLPREAIAPDAPGSIVFRERGRLFTRSDAVLRIGVALGGLWSCVAILYAIPRPIRDFVYRWVARNRYEWFGKQDACRLPTPEEKPFFLD